MVSGSLKPSPALIQKMVSVKGGVMLEEQLLLFGLASEVSEGCIVEIGSWRGCSTVALALGAQHGRNVSVYAVEPHENFIGVLGGQFGAQDRTMFFQNMLQAGCTKTVRLINLPSEVVAKGWEKPIGLLWIDGDHSHEAVKRDVECWEPFVLTQGIVAFHDSLDQRLGPAKVIEEVLSTGRFQRLDQVGLTTVLKKTAM